MTIDELPMQPMKNLSYKRYYAFLISVFVTLIVSGCFSKVKLTADYDDLFDSALHELQVSSIAHINLILKTQSKEKGSYESSQSFYSNIQAQILALSVRASELEDGLEHQPLTDNLKQLTLQVNDLELLHKMPFNQNVFESSEEAFNQSFRAMIKHMLFIKNK